MPATDDSHWIDALRSAAAYRHPVGELQILQTHISWVILTGSLAYKIKKPVEMGFLDFTTLEKRRFYCLEELRLNRRLVEDLYLQVVPITGSFQAPCVGGDGEPIEYAVQMRQFPQEDLLSKVLARGELTRDQTTALAQRVAGFHREAPAALAGSRFGSLASLRHSLEEVFERFELGSEEHDFAMRLRDWCREQLVGHEGLFSERLRQGFVRECHGDMHLGNMLLWRGQPAIFDCIEFNEDFRWIDVLNDAAFTIMDLEDRGAPELAHRFLNAYLEQTGDYSGLPLLPYYLAYRALIRAKVASLRLQQADLEAADQRRELSKHVSYLKLAERYARPQRPTLIITHGLSGSGKTTFTQSLLESIGAVRVRSDIERKRLFDLKPLERSQSGAAEGIYAPESTQRTYARLAELSAVALSGGFSVIVDATFLKLKQREHFRRLAAQLKAPFAILDIQAADSMLRERIVRRSQLGTDSSEADLVTLAWQQRSRELLEATERRDVIPVDTERTDALTSTVHQLQRL